MHQQFIVQIPRRYVLLRPEKRGPGYTVALVEIMEADNPVLRLSIKRASEAGLAHALGFDMLAASKATRHTA